MNQNMLRWSEDVYEPRYRFTFIIDLYKYH